MAGAMLASLLSLCGRRPLHTGVPSFRLRLTMLHQYKAIKEQYKDYVILFQNGEFYEIFGDDAGIVRHTHPWWVPLKKTCKSIDEMIHECLDRDRMVNGGQVARLKEGRKFYAKTILRMSRRMDIPMVGFPVKSLGDWQRTLVQAGFQLAISNQSGKSSLSDGSLINREVVKLVTRGTLIEPLHNEANYLLSVATSPTSNVGLAWTDISTSEFKVSSVDISGLEENLERISPSEVLLRKDIVENIKAQGTKKWSSHDSHLSLTKLVESPILKEYFLTGVPGSWYTEESQKLWKDFEEEREAGSLQDTDFTSEREIEWFENFKKGVSKLEAGAMRALLLFIKYTQKGSIPYLSAPSQFQQAQHMIIDPNTRRALELTVPHMNNNKKATLLGTIDKTSTAPGARLLASRLASPLTDEQKIRQRLEVVDFFYKDLFCRNGLISLLEECQDLERSVQKVVTNLCSVTDLHVIKNTLQRAGSIREFIEANCEDTFILQDELSAITDYTELIDELDRALSGDTMGDYIAGGYSSEIDDLRDKMAANNQETQRLVANLERESSIRFSLVNYKGFMRVLEVTKSKKALADKCTDLVKLESSMSKAKYTHPDLQKLNVEMVALEDKYLNTQSVLYKNLCQMIVDSVDSIMKTAKALARLDVASSLARLASERSYCKPTIVRKKRFEVVGGLHPVVASQQDAMFVTNNCNLNNHSLWLITGPNMGGKSTFLRQNALISILAQMGSFVPADSAVLGVVDRLFARVGASDNVSRNMSTFQVEMTETSHILVNATPRSLVIMDEIGRGTSFSEGLAIAGAVIQYLHDKIGCRCLVATHYHQLTRMKNLPKAVNYKFTAKKTNNRIMFLYRIKPGCVDHSYALDVASLTGIPKEVLKKAQELLDAQRGSISQPLSSHNTLSDTFNLWTTTDDYGNVQGKDLPQSRDDVEEMPSSLSERGQNVLANLKRFRLEHATPEDALNLLHQLKSSM